MLLHAVLLLSHMAQSGQESYSQEVAGPEIVGVFMLSLFLCTTLTDISYVGSTASIIFVYKSFALLSRDIGWLHSHSKESFYQGSVSFRTRKSENESTARKTWLDWGMMRQNGRQGKYQHVSYVWIIIEHISVSIRLSFILQQFRNIACIWGRWTWLSAIFN